VTVIIVSLLIGFGRFVGWNRSMGVCLYWLLYQFCLQLCSDWTTLGF